MPTFARSVFRHWSTAASVAARTAVYGPVRTVVWQGSAGDCCPYADQHVVPGEPRLRVFHEAFILSGCRNSRGHLNSTVGRLVEPADDV